MASTHPASQGAGHNRPVNSGKLFVACSRSAACRQSSRETRSFHSGMRFPSGQASWQNGIPQSMQRSACLLMRGSSAPGTYTSSQSRTRSSTGLRGQSRRGVLMNPLGSAMAVFLARAGDPDASDAAVRHRAARLRNSFRPRYDAWAGGAGCGFAGWGVRFAGWGCAVRGAVVCGRGVGRVRWRAGRGGAAWGLGSGGVAWGQGRWSVLRGAVACGAGEVECGRYAVACGAGRLGCGRGARCRGLAASLR